MLRKLTILCVCAYGAAYLPAIYEKNRDSLHLPAQSGAGIPVAAAPAVTKTTTGAPSGRKVRITADGRGHFVSEFRINGLRISAMVDTGATYIAINRSTARRAGIALAQNDFKYRMETANGTTQAAAVTLASVDVGRIHLNDVEAVVLEDRALSDTLIGMSFLKRLERYGVEDDALLLAQ